MAQSPREGSTEPSSARSRARGGGIQGVVGGSHMHEELCRWSLGFLHSGKGTSLWGFLPRIGAGKQLSPKVDTESKHESDIEMRKDSWGSGRGWGE